MRSLKFGSAPLWAPRQNLGPCHVAGLAVPDLFTPATLPGLKSTLSTPHVAWYVREVDKSGTADTRRPLKPGSPRSTVGLRPSAPRLTACGAAAPPRAEPARISG